MKRLLNYTEFALDGLPANHLLRGHLEQVLKAGQRAAALTRQLLAFSRKQVLQPVSLSLNQVAEFKIYLRRELLNNALRDVKPSTAPKVSTGTETIMVVEDEEALRNVALRILENAGYHVLSAANGDEALLKAAGYDGEIRLLLTDVVMPRMGGGTLAEALLNMRPKLKVLYMSGYTDDTILHHGVLDAGIHFIGKPFTRADLTRKVRAVLDE